MTEQIEQIRAHALANYESGWDVVVEAYSNDEIAEVLKEHNDVQGAIAAIQRDIDLVNEYHLGLSDF